MANSNMGFVWRPRCIEDTVDAGVHPVVAAMRLAQKAAPTGNGQIVGGMDLKAQPWKSKEAPVGGYTYNKRNGPASAVAATDPTQQIERLTGMGMNPQDFFKLAKSTGLNPVKDVLKSKSTVDLPTKKAQSGKEKKKKKKEVEEEEAPAEEPPKKKKKRKAEEEEEAEAPAEEAPKKKKKRKDSEA
uniref:Uncharacterized protein n=1 Tax=Alexandrium andersonii TaxID=327968 RepID=A0A7S2MS95_9DINO|mmetsp:Transcript_74649/g.167201  ORF Transcript_74649/g.167201 Transcript_74649/m.167201 type:complete len:186 (+) Transcript_74649:146-703(+)